MNDKNTNVLHSEEDVLSKLKQINIELAKLKLPPQNDIEDTPHGKLKENKIV